MDNLLHNKLEKIANISYFFKPNGNFRKKYTTKIKTHWMILIENDNDRGTKLVN